MKPLLEILSVELGISDTTLWTNPEFVWDKRFGKNKNKD